MHPEQACIALRAHEHREAFFPLDADFALRVTLQQPKLLCSSHLGETCPPTPDAVGGAVLTRDHQPDGEDDSVLWSRWDSVQKCVSARLLLRRSALVLLARRRALHVRGQNQGRAAQLS